MLKYRKIFFTFFLIFFFQIFLSSFAYSEEYNTKNNTTTWLWDTSLIVNSQESILKSLSDNNISVVYLQINKRIDLKYYKSFISAATDLNISVYALDGSPTFINPTNKQYQLFFDWISNYQSSALDKEEFQGIHLDVEPYLLKNWSKNSRSISLKYQNFILDSKYKSELLDLPIGFDIPFWFDSISFNNIHGKGNLAEFVIKNSDATTVMAYRNIAKDIIEISKSEVAFANKYNKKINIAIETLPSQEGSFISFYGSSYSYMDEQLNLVTSTFSSSNSFNGMSIHDITGLINMKK
ncbi:hypothetical protein [Clostridium grantii]|uniref:Amidase n=1 Tax=Clostridium grantii DSM 8605 TaxID=1121316 RepID=A0A1M5QKB3_9CLOT|nr:hypothetical protein [Clostridium grantii]SHH14346.1 hypothetical protein SAMN02745207_00143 [Clostridium grantii DSM 8605]